MTELMEEQGKERGTPVGFIPSTADLTAGLNIIYLCRLYERHFSADSNISFVLTGA